MDVNEEFKLCENSKKKIGGGVGGGLGGVFGLGVRVGVNEELKFLGKLKKNGGGGGGGVGVRWGSGWWGVRVDVNAMLGVGGDVGNGNKE